MSVNCISLAQGLVVWTWQHEKYSYWLSKEDSFLGAGHSWEANSSFASHENLILWGLKVHYHIHKSPLLLTILAWSDQSILHPNSCSYILILSSNLCLGLPSSLFASGFPTTHLFAPLLSSIRCYLSHPFHSSWFIPPNNIWCRSTDHEAAGCVVFSTSVPLRPS
jgi:hypothetical protein